MGNFSIWEVLFLLCFAISWPVSITRTLRTKVVAGKSPLFMSLIILGYIFGIVNKLTGNNDIVLYLYVMNALLVAIDLYLFFYYSNEKRQ